MRGAREEVMAMNSAGTASQRERRYWESVKSIKNVFGSGFWRMAAVGLVSGIALASLVVFLIWAGWNYPFSTRRSGSLGTSDKLVGTFWIGLVLTFLWDAVFIGYKEANAWEGIFIPLAYVVGFGATSFIFAWFLL